MCILIHSSESERWQSVNELSCYTFRDESTVLDLWHLTEVDQFLPTLAHIHVVVFQTSDFVLHWKK